MEGLYCKESGQSPLKQKRMPAITGIPFSQTHFSMYVEYTVIYTIPCAIIALATFMKPAMFAPFT